METMSIIAFISAVIAFFGAIASGCIAVWSVNRTNRLTKANHRSQIFNEFTRRYQDILMRMPDEMVMFANKFNPEVIKYMTAYFDLCSEEYHLHQKGDIADDVWKIWVEGMRLTTRPQIYRSCWKVLSATYNEDFIHFMHHEILSSEK